MRRADLFTNQAGPCYTQFTLDFKDLTAAAVTQAVNLLANPTPGVASIVGQPQFKIPPNGAVMGVKIVPTQYFTGPGITAMTVSLGITGNAGLFASAFDVLQLPGDTVLQESEQFQSGSRLEQPLVVTFTATGANVNACTQGSVDIFIYYLNLG